MMRRLVLALLLLPLLVAPALAQGFAGAGSTFVQPLLARWAQAFATPEGEGGAAISGETGLDYEPVGSTGGIARVLQGAVEFGATDVPLTAAELARHGLVQFPIASGAVAIVANLPGVETGALRLSGAVVAQVYLGAVGRWSDPAIAGLNPGVRLPDVPITVIRRRDGSGTTYHFAAFLAAASPVWRERVGVATTLDWPVGIGAKGNAELAELVRATPHAIGYVEASQAARLGLAVARLETAGGFVAPDRAGMNAALAEARWDPAAGFQPAVAEAGAYPIVATVHVLMPRVPTSVARSRRAVEFFRAGLTEGGPIAAELGYVPLPAPMIPLLEAHWRSSIRGAR